MFGVLVECCILHIKLCSVYMSRAVILCCSRLYLHIKLCSVYNVESCILHIKLCSVYSRELYFAQKTMFGVLVECCILHIKLCSVYKSRAVFCT